MKNKIIKRLRRLLPKTTPTAALIFLTASVLVVVLMKLMTAAVDREITESKARIAAYKAQNQVLESQTESTESTESPAEPAAQPITQPATHPPTVQYIPLAAAELPAETEQPSVGTVEKWRCELTEEEVKLIAWVTYFEDDTDDNSRTAVAETVLNRVESGKFPSTVSEVLYQPKQFYVMPAADKRIASGENPPEENIAAVLAVFRDGVSIVPEALFFADKSVKPGKIARQLHEVGRHGTTIFWGQE